MKKNDPANWEGYWEWLLCVCFLAGVDMVVSWFRIMNQESQSTAEQSLGLVVDSIRTVVLIRTAVRSMRAAKDRTSDRFERAWGIVYAMIAFSVISLLMQDFLPALVQAFWAGFTAYRLKLPETASYKS